jgi:parvulin-like peptidyl-prolyl isomerase
MTGGRKEKKVMRQWTMVLTGMACAACVVLLGCSRSEKEVLDTETLVVATVGDRSITLKQLEESIEKVPAEYKPDEEGLEGLKKFLDTVINKELMALVAEEEIGELSEPQKMRLERMTRRFVFELVEKREVHPNTNVTDAEIERAYEKRKTAYRVRHILLNGLAEAQRMRSLLDQGAVFEVMANKVSIDKRTAKDGGDLGTVSFGDLPAVIDEALEHMEVGETVGPIKGPLGYHIIRLEEKSQRELPPLDENMRDRLRNLIMARKIQDESREFLAKAKKAVGVKFHPEAMRLLDRRFSALWADPDFLEDPVSIGQPGVDPLPWFPDFSDEDRALPLVTIADSTIYLGDWIDRKCRAPALVWPKGGGEERVSDYLDENFYQDIITAYGLMKGLQNDPEVLERRALGREEFLVGTYYRTRIDTLVPSDEEAKEYYDEHKELFTLPEDLVQATVFYFSDAAAAEEALGSWRGGVSDDVIYKDYKERGLLIEWEPGASFTRSSGETQIFEACWNLEVGQFFGPIPVFEEHVIGRLRGKENAGLISWERSQETARQVIKETETEMRFRRLLEELRERYPVQVFEDTLARSKFAKGT